MTNSALPNIGQLREFYIVGCVPEVEINYWTVTDSDVIPTATLSFAITTKSNIIGLHVHTEIESL